MTPVIPALVAALTIATVSAASAATLTFETNNNSATYSEAGATIAANPGSVNVNTTAGQLGFGCCSGAFNVNWSMTTGGLFDLISVDVNHVDGVDPVTFTGMLGGLAVATTTFTTSVGAYLFSGFTGLDEVMISMNSSTYGDPKFDNLAYQPVSAAVPLPAGLPLLLAGLGGLAALRRRRKA